MTADENLHRPTRAVGQSPERREDMGLVTGAAKYTGDFHEIEETFAAMMRSPHAHARVTGIDTAAAEAMDGVVAVFTAEDLRAEGVTKGIPTKLVAPEDRDTDVPISLNQSAPVPHRPLLAGDRVRYQGQPVAVVVAETPYIAHDALEHIDVAYERLDAFVDPTGVGDPDAPVIHEDAPDNVAFDWEAGDSSRVDDAFAAADHSVSIEVRNQRQIPLPMEPRGALAAYDADTDRVTVHVSSQIPHDHRDLIAGVLELDQDQVHVIVPEVGGGFGVKAKYFPEEITTTWCALQVGRPVAWQATRAESFLADIHGRGHDTTASLAFDDDGTMRGLSVETAIDIGAYIQKASQWISTWKYTQALSHQYAIPAIHCRTIGAFTNKTPIDAYRGPGRSPAAYVVERLIKSAAQELEMDPVAFRRRNLIPPDAFPYATPVGSNYDSGNYEAALDDALDLVDYDAFRHEQARGRDHDRYLGIGVCCFVEATGVSGPSQSRIRVTPDGHVVGRLDTQDTGQGHRTTFAQVLADELDLDFDAVEIQEGDTDLAPEGTGTYAARSAGAGGTALVEGAADLLDRGRAIAADELEAAPADVAYEAGAFHVQGAPERSISLFDVAAVAARDQPGDAEAGLEGRAEITTGSTYPFGAHLAVVAVDASTGEVDLQRYVAVDDVGTQINPDVVEGLIHGGIAQGIGQALGEEVVYDENGALQTGSLLDYAVPRAGSLPDFETAHTVTPSPRNPLGVKGAAESGIVGPPAAVMNAVIDALEPFDVHHLEMPATPETVYRAIHD